MRGMGNLAVKNGKGKIPRTRPVYQTQRATAETEAGLVSIAEGNL